MSNQQLDDLNQENADKKIADILGITYEELSELEYDFGDIESNDGQIYQNYIQFNPEIRKDILKKINLDSDNTYYFDPE
ncbi:hypothetical protein [Chryseobacterium sp. Leaf201]|uniref:hypothetical protein n=1 Tax=Chryseobacterium sp. Leaf201 TaxID=1735672 RepID=UPI000701594B|nr:hypothetical protein [Chryseobacterium sp. Leaf201]KQM47066.1 hypothetical protein ASE55_10720 [Chryseobacterium sp. Leaf201]